jgi:hypothetical protein
VNLFTQFAGARLIYEGDAVAGLFTDDKGVNKDGQPKDNFTPGYELRAKVTVLAEGPRGSLTKDMVQRLGLDGLNPQVYGIGIKELWEVPAGRIDAGYVAHTLGWPLDSSMYGGGWLYGLGNNRASVGMVVSLDYHDPRFDPHQAFNTRRTVYQAFSRRQAGAVWCENASVRRLVFDAAPVCRQGADHRRFGSLLNSQRLRITRRSRAECWRRNVLRRSNRRRFRGGALPYPKKIGRAGSGRNAGGAELYQGFHNGLYAGLFHAGIRW